MKDIKAIVWLTQLGLSVAIPLVGFVCGAVWLRDRYELGLWIIIVGALLGIWGAVDGLRWSLKAMGLLSGKKKDDTPPPVAFNDHD